MKQYLAVTCKFTHWVRSMLANIFSNIVVKEDRSYFSIVVVDCLSSSHKVFCCCCFFLEVERELIQAFSNSFV